MAATRPRRVRQKPAAPADVVKLKRRLAAVMRRYQARERALQEATLERDEAIREVHAAGLAPREIATVTGLSDQRIDQIRRGARL